MEPTENETPAEATADAEPQPVRTEDGIQYFDGSVVKILADGSEAVSDHLAPGEKLRRDTEAEKRYTVGHHSQAAVTGVRA
jgi:hypothetical protein